MEKDFEKIYEKVLSYEEHLHEKNQRKIKIGIKVNIFLPLVFLVLSFAFRGANFFFLVMWIISLFGIAAYLVYVEYSDYKIRDKFREFGLLDSAEDAHLVGGSVEQMEQVLNDRMDMVDARIAEEKERFKEKMAALNNEKEQVKNDTKEQMEEADKKMRGPKE
ncbi:MAG: hypothetical protein K5644_05790 [Lachnospiraceae bacterium]|nr:hypothetical protein [Lachnospiraceae bacterium]